MKPSFIQLACWHDDDYCCSARDVELAAADASSSSPPSSTLNPPAPVRISTVVVHCMLVGIVMQIPSTSAAFMAPPRVMARSFAFATLCICWTYAAGVFSSSASFGARISMSRNQHHQHPRLPIIYVQPFTPCQLRFFALLFLDGWAMPVAAAAMAIAVGERLHRMASIFSSPSSSSSFSGAATLQPEASEVEEEDDEDRTSTCSSDAGDDDGDDDNDDGHAPPPSHPKRGAAAALQPPLMVSTSSSDMAMFKMAQMAAEAPRPATMLMPPHDSSSFSAEVPAGAAAAAGGSRDEGEDEDVMAMFKRAQQFSRRGLGQNERLGEMI